MESRWPWEAVFLSREMLLITSELYQQPSLLCFKAFLETVTGCSLPQLVLLSHIMEVLVHDKVGAMGAGAEGRWQQGPFTACM